MHDKQLRAISNSHVKAAHSLTVHVGNRWNLGTCARTLRPVQYAVARVMVLVAMTADASLLLCHKVTTADIVFRCCDIRLCNAMHVPGFDRIVGSVIPSPFLYTVSFATPAVAASASLVTAAGFSFSFDDSRVCKEGCSPPRR